MNATLDPQAGSTRIINGIWLQQNDPSLRNVDALARLTQVGRLEIQAIVGS